MASEVRPEHQMAAVPLETKMGEGKKVEGRQGVGKGVRLESEGSPRVVVVNLVFELLAQG